MSEYSAALHAADAEIAGLERQIAVLQSALDHATQKRDGLSPAINREPACHGHDPALPGGGKKSYFKYVSEYGVLAMVTSPFIYATAIAFVILDILVTLYQSICFPVYGIAKVKRSDYIVIDRHKLAYLNLAEKFNCVYCGYANGLLAWVSEIASRTEEFWCPIKHAAMTKGLNPRVDSFAGFNDVNSYRKKQEHNASRCMDCNIFKKPSGHG